MRDATRAIPHVVVPTLDELGLGGLDRPRRRTCVLFVARPVLAAGALCWACAGGRVALAIAVVGLLYPWALTLVHHSVHGALGQGRLTRATGLAIGGLLCVHSGHALARTHLQHHGTRLDEPDPEGDIELVSWRRLPLAAAGFRYRLWRWAWGHGGNRPAIAAEAGWHFGVLVIAAIAATHHRAITVAVATLWTTDAVFACLAAKGPQTNWGRPVASPLVRVRCRLARWPLISHNWHLEHHLYPDVAMPRLGVVAERLERWARADADAGAVLAEVVEVRLP